jgi:hypothetical protein
MRPLENRPWFFLLALALSFGIAATIWMMAALPVTLAALSIYLWASLGINVAVNKVFALALIHYKPSLARIG